MPDTTKRGKDAQQPLVFKKALSGLIIVLAVSGLFDTFYASHFVGVGFWSILGVAMMTGGASGLAGGLVGFLFGVPHTREGGTGVSGTGTQAGSQLERGESGSRRGSTGYRPNTSLEQISDWLTKILVGVGLVEVKTIPGELITLAGILAKGLGGGEQAVPFALTLIIYNSVCGFGFGFLWARLYLPKWFQQADEVEVLEEELGHLELQRQNDTHALSLAIQLLNPVEGEERPTDEEIRDAIKTASSTAKGLIFNLSDKIVQDSKAENYSTKIQNVIPILNGLIAGDPTEQNQEFRAQLSYALRRARDLPGALREIDKAIEIRERQKKKGWKWYEFYRARCRIEKDSNVNSGQQSAPELVEQIVSDLRGAISDADGWSKWTTGSPEVRKWMAINNLKDDDLRQK